jgi:hypothetical protein
MDLERLLVVVSLLLLIVGVAGLGVSPVSKLSASGSQPSVSEVVDSVEPAERVQQAKASGRRGDYLLEKRNVDPANLYRALEAYREGVRVLEPLQKREVVLFAELRAKEYRGRELLEGMIRRDEGRFERARALRDQEGAREVLRGILKALPDPADPAHQRARKRLAALD